MTPEQVAQAVAAHLGAGPAGLAWILAYIDPSRAVIMLPDLAQQQANSILVECALSDLGLDTAVAGWAP